MTQLFLENDAKMQIDHLLRDELAPQNGDFQVKYGL